MFYAFEIKLLTYFFQVKSCINNWRIIKKNVLLQKYLKNLIIHEE